MSATLARARALARALAPDTQEWRDALAHEINTIHTRTYVIADAYTHAPITPYAPLTGTLGISADTQRAMPGFTALRADDVTPSRRARFADTLESLALIEAQASDKHRERCWQWHAEGNNVAMRNSLARANRAAEESDRLSDRAHYVRRALGEYVA